MRGDVRLAKALVVEEGAGHEGLGVVGNGQPCLGGRAQGQVIGRAWTTHLRGHPAWVDGVRQDVWSMPRDCRGEHGDEELAVGIRLRAVPAAMLPLQVV